MPRPPMPIGTWGKIYFRTGAGGVHLARARYRDADGLTRLVERAGSTAGVARNNLLQALRDRSRSTGFSSGLVPDDKFSAAADLWWREVTSKMDVGELSPNTLDLYERQLRNYVRPALGALRLREVSTPRVAMLLTEVRKRRSAATAKTVRSVVSGIMALAAKHGAVPINPVRETGRISDPRRKRPRALTVGERSKWLSLLAADERSARADLPDLTRFMLATGVRIGEALAVSWLEVDLDGPTVTIEWKIIRVCDVGLVRVPRPKSEAGFRLLPLPPMAVDMLRRRRAEADGAEGPVFPSPAGGWRDPNNVRRSYRLARGSSEFEWVTSHVFRKTCARILDEAGMSAREIADQLGHARPSITQDVYIGRGGDLNVAAAAALEQALG